MFPHSIIDDNIEVLTSGANILAKIDQEQYQHTPVACFSASAGKHIRHILDHYHCFFDGLPSASVDYDERIRDDQVEGNRTLALKGIKNIIAELTKLKVSIADNTGDRLNKVLSVRLSTSTVRKTETISSSIERELVFLHGHTTHHYAIVAAILKLQGCDIEYAFGIAPSTLTYEEQLECIQQPG